MPARIPAIFGLILVLRLLISATSAQPTRPDIRVVTLNPAQSGPTLFTLQPVSRTQVTFTNSLDAQVSAGNRVLNNGSGVAVGDYNQDGLPDLFFCSLNQRNRLFKNLGRWQFKDATEEAGLKFPPLYFRGATFADLNGDGWPDLLVGTTSRGVLCFLNDQRGRFTDATAEANTATPFANETLALADIDGNGTLDLYVCNNRTDDIRDWARVPISLVNKKPTVPPQLKDRITLENGTLQEFGEPDILYLNDGRAHFRSVSFTNGAFFDARGEQLERTPLDWGLAAAFRDLNGDGAPDLYVCNDYWTPDRLWLNGGRGRFKEADSFALRKIPFSSMGAGFADINRDGHLDIFAVDMLSRSSELRRRQVIAKRPVPPPVGDGAARVQTPRNTLLLNRGDGTFAEIACLAGVEASDWSWSPVFLDADLDGQEDILIAAGHIRDIQDIDANDLIRAQQESWRRSPMAATNLQGAFIEAKRMHAKSYPPLQMPIVAFRNGGQLRFEEVTSGWGLNEPGVNHGIAVADFDNDGDLDLVVNRLGSPAALFQNNSTAPRIAVRLRGRSPNTQAIGARIELLGGPVSNQVHEVTCGGIYMSGSDTLRVFASGNATGPLALRITWRDGSISEVADVKPNHLYELDENGIARAPKNSTPAPKPPPLFEEVSALLDHTHHEEPFDDFARQPLLPRKLSQGGPGIAWTDFNGDGWEDLIIGSGRGGKMSLLRNQQGAAFLPETNVAFAPVTRDQTTLLAWKSPSGAHAILAGAANYEDGDSNSPGAHSFSLPAGTMHPAIPGFPASTGPMSLGDLDGDGDLDLFVGGQVLPGHYPAPVSSRLFKQAGGQWSLDEANGSRLANLGLVNGSVWSDLNADGFPELLLACEWGPLKLFRNDAGKLTPWDAPVEQGRLPRSSLSQFTGLWQSVTTGDFDGDGLLDIVAGNWGWNSAWHASPERPLTLSYGDLAGRDTTDIVECEFDEHGQLAPRHLRDTMAAAVPWIAEKFPTHAAWSRATLAGLLEGRQDRMRTLAVTTLATTVFLNRNDHFEIVPLPVEAQFAPVFGLSVADGDGDGREDLLFAQNFFAFALEESRLDAGRALFLQGDGRGNFNALPGELSGLKVHGEQRGAAVADFNHDGRADWVVTQNGAATKLFRNQTARPGLRVHLAGPPGNPDGASTIVRLKFSGGWGPAREVHLGSGYWSQDSACIVLATPTVPLAIQVLWPGGQRTEQPLSPALREITIQP